MVAQVADRCIVAAARHRIRLGVYIVDLMVRQIVTSASAVAFVALLQGDQLGRPNRRID